jgi:tetratricopeptide (TPR) repeat protein
MLKRSRNGGRSNIGADPGWGLVQTATPTTTGPIRGRLPGRNRLNVVDQLMGASHYNSNVRVCLTLICVCALAAPARAQSDPKTAMLQRAGFEALNAGQIDRAIAAFQEAVSADPKNAELHLGLGAAAYVQQRDADAERELGRALELDEKLDEAREFLGLVLHHEGDLPGAIRSYERWLAAAPPSAETARATDTLARWRQELELRDRMQQTLGEHFTVSFEGPAEADLAEAAVQSLERAYWRIGPLLGVYPQSAVQVVLYTTRQFEDITRSPSWAAGAYDGTIRIPMRGALDKPDELDRVLAHEFTHALVRTLAARAIPTWLNEGLATALEAPDLTWAETTVSRAGVTVPLDALVNSFGRLNGPEASLAYAESAIAVRALLDDIGGTGVTNLIRDLGEGQAFDQAFSHRAQESFTAFSARLAK